MRTFERGLFLSLMAIWLAGCASVLGAECAEGFSLCEGRCVARGTCASEWDGSLGGLDGGGADGSTPRDGSMFGDADDPEIELDGSNGMRRDAGDGDLGGDGSVSGDSGGPLPGCELGQVLCDGICRDALSDPLHCGGCGMACTVSEVCARGECTATCDPPLSSCAGRCIDMQSDPDHCGACRNRCVSGICIEGECSEALAGHIVALGHDYQVQRTGMNRLAGNALFLARGSPVRVLVYEGSALPASRAGITAAINQVATATGRTWMSSVASDATEVPYQLANSDAFIIQPQASTSDTELRELGMLWGRSLDTFLRRGGVIVMFETMTSSNVGTWQILEAAGLFSCLSRTETTGARIAVSDPSDSVALRVPLEYVGERTTIRFDTAEGNIVCRDDTGPVVVHRTYVP